MASKLAEGWLRDGRKGPLPSPFGAVLCAVDGSRGSAEAARQAVALCGPSTSLRFVAVCHSSGVGLSAQADVSLRRARTALDEAAWNARRAGLKATTELLEGGRVSDELLDEASAAGCDLLAIGSHGGSRFGGIVLGATATQLAHRSELPLLVARPHPSVGPAFPRRILLASDGSPSSWAAMRSALALAEDRDAELRVGYVPDGNPERYRELFKQVSAIERRLGEAPEFIDVPGDPAQRLAETAAGGDCSLIVVGKRGVSGVRALGSVSERLVHRAACSVLVVPPPRSAPPG